MSYDRSSRYLKIKLQEIDGVFGFKVRDGRYGLSDRAFFGSKDCIPILAELLVRQELDVALAKSIRKHKASKKKRPKKFSLPD